MQQLYTALLQSMSPLPARSFESLEDWVARVELISAKCREVERVKIRLEKEKQYNRKVEINAILRLLKAEVDGLKT